MGGWRASFLASALALLATVLLTARWLACEGRSPLFALLLLGFPSAVAYGRMATSDVPSAAVVAAGLLLFWRGLDGARGAWLAAGFLAGASTLLRESNVLPFAPLFAGALLRRDRGWPALAAGGALGLALRGGASWWTWGDPLYVKEAGYGFAPANVLANLDVDALGLLVFVPGGLLVAAAYRGRRRPEVLAALALYVAFYLAYGYTARESGSEQRILLRLRFYLPLLPLLVFAYAEALPRLARAAAARLAEGPEARERLQRAARAAVFAWAAAALAGGLALHVFLARYGEKEARVRALIERHTPDGALLVTNLRMTQRYLQPFFAPRRVVDREGRAGPDVDVLADRHDEVYVVLLDRFGSPYLAEHARENAGFLACVAHPLEAVLRTDTGPEERLAIWRVRRGAAETRAPAVPDAGGAGRAPGGLAPARRPS